MQNSEAKHFWTFADAANLLCDSAEIGTEKPVRLHPGVENAHADSGQAVSHPSYKNDGIQTSYTDPATTEDAALVEQVTGLAKARGISPTDAEAMALLMMEVDPEAFAKRNPTIYLDLLRQQRLERVNKATRDEQLATITATRLSAMSTMDVLKRVAAPVLTLPTEHRDAVLEAWGLSPDELRVAVLEMDGTIMVGGDDNE